MIEVNRRQFLGIAAAFAVDRLVISRGSPLVQFVVAQSEDERVPEVIRNIYGNVVIPEEVDLGAATFTLTTDRVPPKQYISAPTPELIETGYKFFDAGGKWYQPSIPMPESVQETVYREINAVNGLLPADWQISRPLFFAIGSGQEGLDGHANQITREIEIYFGFFNKAFPLRKIGFIAFHESAHELEFGTDLREKEGEPLRKDKDTNESILYLSYLVRFDRNFRQKIEPKFTELRSNGMQMSHDEFIDEIFESSKYYLVNPLFNIITERCYLDDYEGGRPYNTQELFACTSTVMRFFPQSLMATVEALEDPEEKAFMKEYLTFHLNNLRHFTEQSGHDPKDADQLFAPDLVAYLDA